MADGGGRGNIAGAVLRSYLERVERLAEDKKAVQDDIKAVYAEAKANGYTPKYLRAIIRLRALPVEERQEDAAMMELYMSAIGMTREAPLFSAAGMMGEDAAAREAMVEALKTIVPPNGELIVKCGGTPVRVWRDAEGVAQAEDWSEPSASPSASERKPSARREPKASRETDGPVLPGVDEAEAIALGRAAAKKGVPVTGNPFPFGDRRQEKWEFGWCDHMGSDGMGPASDDLEPEA
jgi:uncharacterized protein (UPF0335 family)